MAGAKYSKVERRIWRDEKLREFPRIEPTPAALWHYLLFNEAQTAFPGLFVLRILVVADDLRWTVEEVRTALQQIIARGMAQFDERTSVVWLPNALRKNSDGLSIKNTRGWRNAWNEMPDSPVTRAAYLAAIESIREATAAEGKAASSALDPFVERAPKWTKDAPSMGDRRPFDAPSMGDRSQDQDQDQEREQEQEGAPAPPAATSVRQSWTAEVTALVVASADALATDRRELEPWARGLVAALDLPAKPDVSPVPYVRAALASLGDQVAGRPTMLPAHRLTYLRKAVIGMVNDDKPNGWASGKTDGRAGVCAPPQRKSDPGYRRSTPDDGRSFLETELANMEAPSQTRQRPASASRGGEPVSIAEVMRKRRDGAA